MSEEVNNDFSFGENIEMENEDENDESVTEFAIAG